ncbi:MAG: hypothetical protein QIT36_gp053 [Methanophagales virus GBV301]|uniref:Uncharacterized protein n=1 Tax=Methanophagales virus GBV301 TaxID=2999280 RepID=A0A9E9AA41_9CAUD|nr:MAG: hypothetical protein QIT36_gp053 [Methanophagales virus GBV301]WAE39477.1 MAG: hypothetical protein LDLAKGPJ_00053 [Methanophagales virus GBV301]
MIEVKCNPGDDYLPTESFKISLPALEERGYRELFVIGLASIRGDDVIYINNLLLRDVIYKNTLDAILIPLDAYGFHKWEKDKRIVLGLPWGFRKEYIAGRKEALKRILKYLFEE